MSSISQSVIQLPPEVMDLVCEYLPRPDLRALRTAFKSAQLSAELILFRTIYLQFNRASFERLQKIADHPRLRKFVRFLDYDGRQVRPDSVGKGVGKWVELNAGQGIGLHGEQKKKFLAQFAAEDLQRFYASYLLYVSGQEFLLRNGNSKRLLSNTIPKLPGLQGVRYSAPSSYRTRGRKIPSLHDLIAQDILEVPDGLWANSLDNFWHLLEPFCFSTNDAQLVSIRGSDLDFVTWNKRAATLSEHFQDLSPLRYLSLDFHIVYHQPWSTSELSKLLVHLPELQSLRLSFGGCLSFTNSENANLEDIMGGSRRWTSLKSLSLQAIVTSDKFLRGFLTSHAKTLRWLELSYTNLWEPSHDLSEDWDGEEPEVVSFLELFQFLQETMSLEHVRFNENFSNTWNEAWTSPEPDDRDHYPYDCLKYRIERFITNGEPFPFRELSDDDKGAGFYGVPFAYEQDFSWRFEDFLLADL